MKLNMNLMLLENLLRSILKYNPNPFKMQLRAAFENIATYYSQLDLTDI